MSMTYLDSCLDGLRFHRVRLPHAIILHVDELPRLAVHTPRRVSLNCVLGLQCIKNKIYKQNLEGLQGKISGPEWVLFSVGMRDENKT